MGIDLAAVAGGAIIGGVASDLYDKTKDKAADLTGNNTPEHGPVEMQIIMHLVSEIHKAWFEDRNKFCPAKMMPIALATLGAGRDYEYKRRNYKHVSLLLGAATSLDVVTPIGTITFAMNKGWNPFDMPDDSIVRITGAGPTTMSAYLYYGDDSIDMPGA